MSTDNGNLSPEARLDRLLGQEIEGELPPFLFFWGDKATATHAGRWVLSQWWPASFEVDSISYSHAEVYLMCEKARLFRDNDMCEQILNAEHPAQAKDLGRRVRGFEESVWMAKRYEIAIRGNLAKFSQNDDLLRYLLSTAPRVLAEASPRDSVWGIGLSERDGLASRPSEWKGRNLLGFALMDVRERLS